ncbi:MAG: P-loop NTPase, partial [Methanosarcinaceae archaeon]|nr:P-loop NTPase [Methanosarcinaceae archaeon]
MSTDKQKNRKKVIAVGGAKGGIGKSIFAVNLALLLSSVGRTVIIDLDLGGANLHLYLGETHLRWNINDFLNRKIATLQEALVQSRYGVRLIGGDSSQLGSANINFSLKLKLLKAIQQIDADYVILDLGGDTSYNMLDFFLASDCGIVLTTRDPASYLDAYNFIKVSLFRKLNLLLGSNSGNEISKNISLKRLVHEATLSPNGSRVKTINEL